MIKLYDLILYKISPLYIIKRRYTNVSCFLGKLKVNSMDKKPNTVELKSHNYFMNLLKGNVPLWTTYWVYYFLVGIFFNIINKIIEFNYFSLNEHFEVAILGYFYFIVAYQLLISVAVWNSAGNYKGKKLWAILARISAVLVVIVIIVTLVIYQRSYTKITAADIAYLNHSLPAKIDEDTELESITMEGDDIFYNYKLINVLVSDVDIPELKKGMEGLKKEACTDKDIKELMDQGKNLHYVYKDKENKEIAKEVVKSTDCAASATGAK